MNSITVCLFINIRNLSLKHINLAQKLSWYHFEIEKSLGKSNKEFDCLSVYFPFNTEKKAII